MTLCCEWCQVTVSHDRIKKHLKSPSHKDKNVHLHQTKLDEALGAMNIAKTHPPPPITTLHQQAPPSFQGLKLLEGFACTICTQLGLSESYMKDHYSREHHINILTSKLTRCYLQRYSLANTGPLRALFRVQPPSQDQGQQGSSLADRVCKQMAAALTRPHLRNQADQRCISPWLLTTKWHEHVKGFDVKELCNLIAFPTKAEYPGLSTAVQEYFAEATAQMDSLQELTLQILNTADPVKTWVTAYPILHNSFRDHVEHRGINNTPLHRFQLDGTLKEYCTVIVRQLSMLLRSKKKYLIPLHSKLEHALGSLAGALQDGGNPELIKAQLHPVFMGLWQHKWQPTADNAMPNPTIRALALITLRPDGHFAEPYQVTGLIAKWERLIRLACVKEIKHMSETMEEEEACKELQPWFTEKILSTFNSLRSLQHRASAIAKTTMGLGRVLWVDRTNWTSLLYQGTSISLEQMVMVNHAMEDKLIELWEQKVLLGLQVKVQYGKLVEDLSNTNVGYSFLTDSRNEALKDQDHLLLAIVDSTEKCPQFLQFDAKTGHVVWNKSALRQWLLDYSNFQRLALTRCEMLAGGPGRSTEFTSMQQHNTVDRNTRNIHILDNYVAIVRQYHKSAQLTGQDTFIPHALDGVMSDLLVQDLVLAKPFAQFAAHLCFPDQPDIQELYRDYLFVNNTQLFTVESMTEVLKDYTLPVLGVSLGIRDWRHVAIAFKRKLCSEAMQLYEGAYPGDNIHIRQASHSRALEDRLYGLSPDALLGAAEDLLPLFMAASTKWQVLHKAVPGELHITRQTVQYINIISPGGLRLSYTEARTSNFNHLVKSGVIKLEQSAQLDGRTPEELGDIFVDKVVDRLRPILENLVTQTLQDVIRQTFQDTFRQVQDQGTIAALHIQSPHQDIAPVVQANQDDEDDWDQMYLNHPPAPRTITPTTPDLPRSPAPPRSTASAPQLHIQNTPPIIICSSPTLPTPPQSTPSEEPPLTSFMVRDSTPPHQPLLIRAPVTPTVNPK